MTALTLVVVAGSGLYGAIVAPAHGQTASGQAGSRCGNGRAIGLEGLDQPLSRLRAATGTVALENSGARQIEYDFGGSRGADADRYLTFSVPQGHELRPSDVFVSLPSPLQEREGEGKDIWPTSNKQLSYTVSVGRGTIEIRFCLDPDRPREVSPGSYQGALLVETVAGVKPASVPITADLRHSDEPLVWLIAFGSLLAALIVKTFGDLAKDESKPISWRGFLSYVNRWSFIWQFIGGAALTAVTVWQVFYSSSDFGGQNDDWSKLVGAIAIAVISGISLASFANLGKSAQIVPTTVVPEPAPAPPPPQPPQPGPPPDNP